MGMEQKLRAFLASEELDIPARRGQVECGEFSDLFYKRNFGSQYHYGTTSIDQVFAEHSEQLNEFAREMEGVQVASGQDERVEMIYGALHKLARTQGTTLFRLLTGATPEQESSYRFHEQFEMGLTFTDYIWAVGVNVTPEEMYEAARTPLNIRGLLRASQGRVDERVRIIHVQHVLNFPRASRSEKSENFSYNIKELSAAYAEGFLPDEVFRALLLAPLDREQFAAAIEALREGVDVEYAIAAA